MERAVRFLISFCLLVTWLMFEGFERAVSRFLLHDELGLRDWRRRHHPSVSCREWRLFGRWVIARTRAALTT